MPQSQKDPGSGLGGSLAAGGAVLLAVACCALGPLLIAGGVLGVAGGVLRSPMVLSLAALLILGAVLFAVHRGSRARRPRAANPEHPQERAGDCCAPGPTDRRDSHPTPDRASHSQEP